MLHQDRNVLKTILSIGWLSLIWGKNRSKTLFLRCLIFFNLRSKQKQTLISKHFHKSIKSEVNQSNEVKQHFARKRKFVASKRMEKTTLLKWNEKKPLEMKCVSKVCSHFYWWSKKQKLWEFGKFKNFSAVCWTARVI
jgi:hypothetical protein